MTWAAAGTLAQGLSAPRGIYSTVYATELYFVLETRNILPFTYLIQQMFRLFLRRSQPNNKDMDSPLNNEDSDGQPNNKDSNEGDGDFLDFEEEDEEGEQGQEEVEEEEEDLIAE